jgi:hypothetical protein
MIRLLILLVGAGMFAAAFSIVRAALFGVWRGPSMRTITPSTGPSAEWAAANIPITRRLNAP